MSRTFYGNWTTLHRAEAFVALGEELSWKAAHEKLFGESQEGKTDTRKTWQLVHEFIADVFGSSKFDFFTKSRDGTDRLTFNSQGIVALERAQRFLGAANELRRVGASEGSVGSLRLACYPAHINRIVGSLVASAGLVLQIQDDMDLYRLGGGRELLSRLVNMEADAVVAPLTDTSEGVASEELYTWSLVAVAQSGRFPIGHISAELLLREPLLLSPLGHVSRDAVENIFRQRGRSPEVRHASASTETLLSLVDAGVGVAILPDDSVWHGEKRAIHQIRPAVTGIHGVHWREAEELTDERLRLLLALINDWRDDAARRDR